MIKNILTLLFLMTFSITLSAQNDSTQLLWKEVYGLKNTNKTLQKNNSELHLKISAQQKDLNDLKKRLAVNSENIQKVADSLGIKIYTTQQSVNQKYVVLDKTLSKSALYGIIAFLLAALLSLLIYFLLTKRQKLDKTDVLNKIRAHEKTLTEETVKLYSKFSDLLNAQVAVIKEERATWNKNKKAGDLDHSLALKVADNVARMIMNLTNMDSATRGLNQLKQSVNSVVDNFKANGYEIVDLLNKPYHEGMKVTANMEPDDNLKPGEMIIKRVVKPQVNYNGVMIQSAEVIVAYGE